MKNNSLAAGFGVRPITWSDLEAVQQVIYTACKADGNESLAPTLEELAMDWRSPDFNPATDAWVGTSPGGKVIGYERNVHTIEELNRNGFRIIPAEDLLNGLCEIPDGKCVITIPGSELARGGGGARCMSMPIRRKKI